MLIYLAANNHGGFTGLGGLIASAITTLISAVTTAELWNLHSLRKRRALHALADSVNDEIIHVHRMISEETRQLEGADQPSTELEQLPSTEVEGRTERIARILQERARERQPTLADQAIAANMAVQRRMARDLHIAEASYSRLSRIREKLQLSEAGSRFWHARVAFYAFLSITVVSSGILLYGAYLAISGHVASGIIVALSSAVPGGFSAGLYRISHSAERRADDAFKALGQEVERETQIDRMLSVSSLVGDEGTHEALQTLGALKAAFPEASAQELSSLLNTVRTRSTYEQESDQVPD